MIYDQEDELIQEMQTEMEMDVIIAFSSLQSNPTPKFKQELDIIYQQTKFKIDMNIYQNEIENNKGKQYQIQMDDLLIQNQEQLENNKYDLSASPLRSALFQDSPLIFQQALSRKSRFKLNENQQLQSTKSFVSLLSLNEEKMFDALIMKTLQKYK